jgi:thioredoxin reductase (NADPH)
VDSFTSNAVIYGPLLIFILGTYLAWQWQTNRKARQRLETAMNSGMHEPVSLHPQIDAGKCMGCGACVSACPEGDILGLINRKAELVAPAECIGHGACREACPSEAITLVFGSSTRGVDIPLLSQDFETSVPGIFIAGELGGMGLIKNAITQGRQAVEAIAKRVDKAHAADYDLIIVGAGPAGLAAALEAKARKLKFAILEQDSVGGTLAHYPRGKMVMTQPAELPLVGKFQFREASKEALVDFWHDVIRKTGLTVQINTRVESIDPGYSGFEIATTKGTYKTNKVLLALGRRGTPRKLEVPGEELSKVVYRLIDPEQYIGQKVLVVGGGDSALEAAISIAKQPGTRVTLSYRGKAFARAKKGNRERLTTAQGRNHLDVYLESQILEIAARTVTIDTSDGIKEIPNDAVIICAGGLLPTPFLHKVGIQVEAKFGTA